MSKTLATLCLGICTATAAWSGVITNIATWNAAGGDWSNAANWSPNQVPNNYLTYLPATDHDFNVYVTGGSVTTSAAAQYAVDALFNSGVINVGGGGLAIGSTESIGGNPIYYGQGFANYATGTINVGATSQFAIDVSGPVAGSQILNNGNINVAGSLSVYGSPPGVTLAGSGTITMQGGAISFNDGAGSFGTLYNAGNTIQGYGNLSAGYGFGLNNASLINANDSLGRALEVSTGLNPPSIASYSFNSGTLQASNGGTLWLSGSASGYGMTNAGTIQALNNSTVLIDGRLVGGTISTAGTGQLVVGAVDGNGNRIASTNAVLDGSQAAGAFHVAGPLQVSGGSTLTLWGDIASNGAGSITLGTASSPATIQLKSDSQISNLVYFVGNVVTPLPGGVILDHTPTGSSDHGQLNELIMAPNAGNTISGSYIPVQGYPIGIPTVLDVGSNYTIQGAGTIQNVILLNQGTISVSQGVPLTLDWSGVILQNYPALYNEGVINVADNNTLILKGSGEFGGGGANTCTGVQTPGIPGNYYPYCIDNMIGAGQIKLGSNSTLQVSGDQGTYFTIWNGLQTKPFSPTSLVTFSGVTGNEILQTINAGLGGSLVVDNLTWISQDAINLYGGGTLTVNSNATVSLYGTLTLNEDSSAIINGNLATWNAATGTFGGGTLKLYGANTPSDIPGTFRFTGADILHLANNTYIQGNGQVTDLNGNDALQHLAGIDGTLTFDGHTQTTSAAAFAGTGSLYLQNAAVFHLPNAASFSERYLSISETSTLDLPNATTFSIVHGDLTNGAFLNLPQVTTFSLGESTNNDDHLNLDNASLILPKGGITAENATISLQNGSTVQIGGPLVATGQSNLWVYDTSTFSSKGADIQGQVYLGASTSTANFTGGQFHNVDSSGTLQYGNFNLTGQLIYDTFGGASAAGITTIGTNATVYLNPGGQFLSSTNGVTTDALAHLSQINGTFVTSNGFTTDQFLTIGAQGEAGFVGTATGAGIDNHGYLIIDGHATFVGIDTPAVQNNTLLYGYYDITGTLDYSGQAINTIGANATVILRGAGTEMIHHSTPGDAFASLSDVQGVLDLYNGAGITTSQVIHNEGTINNQGSISAAGLVQDNPNAILLNLGTLNLNGGTLDLESGQFFNYGTVNGNFYINGLFTATDNQGTINGDFTIGPNGDVVFVNQGSYNNGGTIQTDGYNSINNFSQGPNGVLDVVITAPDDGNHYFLTVINGTVHLDGALNVSWGPAGNDYCYYDVDYNQICGEIGTLGEIFHLLSWNSGSWDGSEFSAIDLPALDPGLQWADLWSPTGLSIEVEQATAAPEPATWPLLLFTVLLGLRALGLVRIQVGQASACAGLQSRCADWRTRVRRRLKVRPTRTSSPTRRPGRQASPCGARTLACRVNTPVDALSSTGGLATGLGRRSFEALPQLAFASASCFRKAASPASET